jgi:hypothetical protein
MDEVCSSLKRKKDVELLGLLLSDGDLMSQHLSPQVSAFPDLLSMILVKQVDCLNVSRKVRACLLKLSSQSKVFGKRINLVLIAEAVVFSESLVENVDDCLVSKRDGWRKFSGRVEEQDTERI